MKSKMGIICALLCVSTVAMVYGENVTDTPDKAMVDGKMSGMNSETVLTILHSSDGESALLANDYSGSVAQFAAVIGSIVEEVGVDNALVVSSGDNFLAGVEYAASQGVYDARALSRAGFEVSAIGNHEFDFGPTGLEKFMVNANFIFVSSNLDVSQEPALRRFAGIKLLNHHVIEKAGRKIGLVGATTEEIAYISSPGNNIEIKGVRESLQAAVDALKQQGVDIIIALTHLQNIEEEKKLATLIDGIDIFIAGGGDDLIGNGNNSYLVRQNKAGDYVRDTPTGGYPFYAVTPSGEPVAVVSTDGSYNYVGRLDVTFDAQGIIKSIGVMSGPIAVNPNIEPDRNIQTNIVEVVGQDIERFAEVVVGQTIDGLNGTREAVRTRESTMGNAITDGYLYVVNRNEPGSADFAFTNGGGIRRSIVVTENSAVTKQQVLTALPFPNYLTIISNMNAEEIRQLFEHAVAKLPEAGGQFLQVAGITVVYDSSRPAGSRIQSIRIGNDQVVADGAAVSYRRYNAVTNSFLAAGGDGYEVLGTISKRRKIGSGYSYADGFELYLQENSPIQSPISGRLVDMAQ